jgi:phage anti-repressor protein
MFNVIIVRGHRFVTLSEFYNFVNGDAHNYNRWVKNYVTDRPDGMSSESVDYVPMDSLPVKAKQVGRGRKKKDFLISIDFLKQLCMDIKTYKCREVRNWANGL